MVLAATVTGNHRVASASFSTVVDTVHVVVHLELVLMRSSSTASVSAQCGGSRLRCVVGARPRYGHLLGHERWSQGNPAQPAVELGVRTRGPKSAGQVTFGQRPAGHL